MEPLLCPAARSLPPERLGRGAEVRVLLCVLSTQHPTHTSGRLQAWEVGWEGWGGGGKPGCGKQSAGGGGE